MDGKSRLPLKSAFHIRTMFIASIPGDFDGSKDFNLLHTSSSVISNFDNSSLNGGIVDVSSVVKTLAKNEFIFFISSFFVTSCCFIYIFEIANCRFGS